MGCTAAHLRSRSLNIVSLSDMIEGFYNSWDLYTTGQLVDGLQQKKKKKKENRKTGNRIMSSFLGRQFHRSTLYICFSWQRETSFFRLPSHNGGKKHLIFFSMDFNSFKKCVGWRNEKTLARILCQNWCNVWGDVSLCI